MKKHTGNTTKQTLIVYWQHVSKYPFYLIGLLTAQLMGVLLFRLIPPIIAASILDRLVDGDFVKGDVWRSFGSPMILYALSVIGGGVIMFRISNYFNWQLESSVVRDLYQTMFNKLVDLSTDFHANNFGGSLVSRTTKFVSSFIRLSDTIIYQLYALLISFIFISATLYSRAPTFVWLLIIFSVLFVSGTIMLSRRVRELSAVEADAQNRTTGYLADAVTNVMAIKSFSAIRSEEIRFAESAEYTKQRSLDVMWSSIKRDLFASSITASVQIMAITLSVVAVAIYDFDIATIFLMLTYSIVIADRLFEFSISTLKNFNRSIGDAQEAILTLSEESSVKDPDAPEPARIEDGGIVFNSIHFTHEGDQSDSENILFQDFNLYIQPGEKIGLVGHSGSGKTTLTKLLLRFMDLDSGKIMIDGQDIAHIRQDNLREHIAYVPQEPLLFHRSLAENIRYGNTSASDSEVIEKAKMAHAHEFIERLPRQYETLVGERGVKLSGGQRQRIAIARAMLKRAPILVLDEATSSLDSESEKLIQDALWKLMEGRTALVIAHRLSTIQKMDRIIVLDDGKIVEQGSHKELLVRGGKYAELWAHQSGGFLEE